jgi:phytoene synthase
MSVLTRDYIEQPSLAASRDYCKQLTRLQAKNFYHGLKLLPEPKRSAMFTLYAYMRLVDDIADNEDGRPVSQRLEELETWRAYTHAILDGRDYQSINGSSHGSGNGSGHAGGNAVGNGSTNGMGNTSITDTGRQLWPAFSEMVHEYRMPRKIFDDVIAGQRQDLEPQPLDTFDQLHEYCYRVAGVVGLASIYIWGFEGGAETESLAIDRGVAFQLTNILRDLREDAARGRIYLPLEDLAVMNVTEEDLIQLHGGPAFGQLMNFQIQRAEDYYTKSQPLEERIQRDSRPTLVAMTEIYHRLLKAIARNPQRVLRERVSLSLMSKVMIAWQATRSR